MDELRIVTPLVLWWGSLILGIAFVLLWVVALRSELKCLDISLTQYVVSQSGPKCMLYLLAFPTWLLLGIALVKHWSLPRAFPMLMAIGTLVWIVIYAALMRLFLRELLRGGVQPLVAYLNTRVRREKQK